MFFKAERIRIYIDFIEGEFGRIRVSKKYMESKTEGKIMRRFGIGIVLVAAALLLSSCSMAGSRLAELNRTDKSESELIDGRFEQVFEAIENKDKDAFKEIFSQEALETSVAFDEAIEFLFVTFPDGIDSWERITTHTSDSVNYGERTQSIDAPYDVFVGDTHYRVSILVHTIDTENPEKVGLYSLIVDDEEERKRKIYEPGIQITIGDRIIPQPPEGEDPFANEKTFERYDLFFTVPAGLERQTFGDAQLT